MPSGEDNGGRPALVTSLYPLDRCQSSASVSIMYSVKLARCQACQESSNRTLPPIPTCPGCPEFRDLAGPVLRCSNPLPGSKKLSNSTLTECGPAHQPLSTLHVPATPYNPYALPESPCPLREVLTIPLGIASHPVGAVPGREETGKVTGRPRPSAPFLEPAGQRAVHRPGPARRHLAALTAP